MSRTRRTIEESSSKRLRSVFYLLWEKDNKGFEKFDDYYYGIMEKLINFYKKILNE